MLERFLAQTLTTPNLSVESSFGTFGKHWNNLVADAIGLKSEIQKTSEDKTPRSPLVVGVWRVQVHGVEAWKVFCYSCTMYSNFIH